MLCGRWGFALRPFDKLRVVRYLTMTMLVRYLTMTMLVRYLTMTMLVRYLTMTMLVRYLTMTTSMQSSCKVEICGIPMGHSIA